MTLETHETRSQPSPGLWLVTETDRELVKGRYNEYWKTHRVFTGSIETTVEASREAIQAMREVYDQLVERRAQDEARHARDLIRCERQAANALRGARPLDNLADPFASLRGEA